MKAVVGLYRNMDGAVEAYELADIYTSETSKIMKDELSSLIDSGEVLEQLWKDESTTDHWDDISECTDAIGVVEQTSVLCFGRDSKEDAKKLINYADERWPRYTYKINRAVVAVYNDKYVTYSYSKGTIKIIDKYFAFMYELGMYFPIEFDFSLSAGKAGKAILVENCYVDNNGMFNLSYETMSMNTMIIPNSIENIREIKLGNIKKLVIPSSVRCLGISSRVKKYEGIKEVYINNGVKVILNRAFSYCSELEKINIPETVEAIGDNAFTGCIKLREIEIPSSVRVIGTEAFAKSGIKKIELSESLEVLGVQAFYVSELESVKIGSNIDILRVGTFSGCSKLTQVSLSDSIKRIGGNAFKGCTKLKSIRLPKNLERINKMAFYHCECLEEIDIPASVEYIGDRAFAKCTNLKRVIFHGEVSSLGVAIFELCYRIKEVIMPVGVNMILGREIRSEMIVHKSMEEV